MSEPIEQAIDQFRLQFDATYLAGLPLLLNEPGAALAWSSMLTAIDSLAAAWSPAAKAPERFRGFVQRYFCNGLDQAADELWQLRQELTHGLAPAACELRVHRSAQHLTRIDGRWVLNAEDSFAELALASNRYFSELLTQAPLRAQFRRRLSAAGGELPDGPAAHPARDAS